MRNNPQRRDIPVPATYQDRNGEYLPSTEFRTSIPEWEGEDINLREYLEILFRRKWLILATLFFVFLSTLVFTLTSSKIFRATGRLEVIQKSPQVTQFEEVVTSDIKSAEFLSTQVSLLRSDALAKRVADKLNFSKHPLVTEKNGLRNGIGETIKAWFLSILPVQKEQDDQLKSQISSEILIQEDIRNFIDDRLSIYLERNTSIVTVAFDSSDRQLSQDFVNTLIDEFILWKMDQKLEATQYAKEYLNKQMERAKINLEKTEEELNRFAKLSNIVSLDSKLNSEYSQLEELNTALAQAESDLINKKAAYNQAMQDGPASLPMVLSSPVIADLKSEYSRLQSEYEDLSTTFMDEYPAVKRIKSKMLSIDNRIKAEQNKILRSFKNEYQTAQLKFEALKDRLKNQKKAAMGLNEKATQYKILGREVETNKSIYQTLLQRSKEIESMAGVSTGNINIVDRATLPIFPYKPDVKKNLLIAILLGLMIGIGAAFLIEHFDDTIKNPDQIADQFQIPILGVLPLAKDPAETLDKGFLEDPHSPFSESIRTAKVSIQLSSADRQAQKFVVTSTGPSEGKSTVSLNLAMAFAGSNERVLLIDCDLRKPRLHKVLGGKDSGIGLTNILTINEKIDTSIKQTDINNLWFLPSGPIPPNPVELLASNKFDVLMEQFENQFDRIILDSPPFQGFADILVLSRKVGGIVLVSTIGETKREDLRQFKKGMMNVQGHILGCLVNKVSANKGYGYYSYYTYSQYDQSGESKKNRKKRKASTA